MRRFVAAEGFLRDAIEFDPGRYNAWKNLGVSLEHQGRHEEAAACYFEAVTKSGNERRSVLHFRRLVERESHLPENHAIREFHSTLPTPPVH